MLGHRQVQVASPDSGRFGPAGPEEHQRPDGETIVVTDILALIVVMGDDDPATGLPGFLQQTEGSIATIEHHRIEISLGKHLVK